MTPHQSTVARAAEAGKKAAGRAALEEVRSGMTLGLGTGSTVRYFIEGLGAALASGELGDIRGVPTSKDTEERATTLGIPLIELHEAGTIDLAVDGADEVDPSLDLIKGLGGALLREKMVVQATDRFLVVVDPRKYVERLGSRSPLPVEVAPFGWRVHLDFFRDLGARPKLRDASNGEPFVTDNGNFIVDLTFPEGIEDPAGIDRSLQRRAGVVESGLFLGAANRVLVGDPDRLEILDRGGDHE